MSGKRRANGGKRERVDLEIGRKGGGKTASDVTSSKSVAGYRGLDSYLTLSFPAKTPQSLSAYDFPEILEWRTLHGKMESRRV